MITMMIRDWRRTKRVCLIRQGRRDGHREREIVQSKCVMHAILAGQSNNDNNNYNNNDN